MTQDVARQLHIQESEYSKLAAVSHSVVAGLKQIDAEAQAHIRAAKSKGSPPDLKTLQEYERRRQRILSDAVQNLRASLRPESWQGLHAYVNGEHREQIHSLKPIPIAPPGTTAKKA